MKLRMSALLPIAAILAICASIAGAQSKPDLSGTWKMNPTKSQFANGGPDAITIKINHKDPSLTESLILSNGGNERSVELKYTTDGKESPQEVMGATAQTSAKWEGETLTIDWKAEGRSFTRKIKLSVDGKTMTMSVRQAEADGQEAIDTVVLEKQ